MANPFTLMKLRNILSPTVSNSHFLNPTSEMNDGSGMDTFNPEHTAIDKFNELVTNEPQYKRPGFLRTLLGGGIAALTGGGPEGAREIIDAPYNREMANWKSKIEPAYQAANLERQSNIAGQSRIQQEREAVRKETADERRFEIDQSRLKEQEQNRMRQEQEFRDQETRIRELFDKGAINAKELEKLRNENAQLLEQTRQEGRETLEQMQNRHARELEGQKQAGRIFESQLPGKPTEMTPANQKIDQANRARQFALDNPDLAKYIHVDRMAPNSVEIDPPSKFGISQQDYDRIRKALGGGSTSTPSTTREINTVPKENAPPELGKESGITRTKEGKFIWTTEHGKFEWDGKGWIKVG